MSSQYHRISTNKKLIPVMKLRRGRRERYFQGTLPPNLTFSEARNRKKIEEYYLHSRSSITNLPYCVSNPPHTPTPPPQHSPGTDTGMPRVYPPPSAPTPRTHGGTMPGLWCEAKPTVPDPIIWEAMDYACGAGAACESIQHGGLGYHPNTLLAHASFAFNSYWQRTKVAGGTCDAISRGTAILITIDPSYGGCYFNIY